MNSKLISLTCLLLLCFSCNLKNQEQAISQQDQKDQLNRIEIGQSDLDKREFYQASDSIGPQAHSIPKSGVQPPKEIEWDKKIIKTAVLNGEVKDYKNFSQQLSGKVKEQGGYISSEVQSQSADKIENTMVIKVPVERFEDLVNALAAGMSTLNDKTINSDDVTTELIDGKSRLEAKRQVRLRYLELLKSAKNMGEILNVQKEINAIQEEIETVAGRINLLSHSSAMSTINLTFSQVLNPTAKTPDNTGFFARVKSSIATGWFWLGECLIALAGIWPLIIGAAIGIILLKRRNSALKSVPTQAK